MIFNWNCSRQFSYRKMMLFMGRPIMWFWMVVFNMHMMVFMRRSIMRLRMMRLRMMRFMMGWTIVVFWVMRIMMNWVMLNWGMMRFMMNHSRWRIIKYRFVVWRMMRFMMCMMFYWRRRTIIVNWFMVNKDIIVRWPIVMFWWWLMISLFNRGWSTRFKDFS